MRKENESREVAGGIPMRAKFRAIIGGTPFLLTLTTLLALSGVGAVSMFYAPVGPIYVRNLVTDFRTVDMNLTTYTRAYYPAAQEFEQLCTINTYGQLLTMRFQIVNTTSQLAPYFDFLNVTVKMVGAGGFSQTAQTKFVDGSATITVAPIQTTSTQVYTTSINIHYGSKGNAGTLRIGINIWAEG
jgi:hypothetical protein